MKHNYYMVTGSFATGCSSIHKKFKSADTAMDYAMKLMLFSGEVQDEIMKNSNSLEYVISQDRRFTITQVTL